MKAVLSLQVVTNDTNRVTFDTFTVSVITQVTVLIFL